VVSDVGTTLLEEMLQASPDALVVVNADGLIEVASNAVKKLFGYSPAELVGKPLEILIPVRMRHRHAGLRQSFFRHPEMRPMGVGLELKGLRRDGTEFSVDVSLVPSVSGGGSRVGAFVRDATERQRGEDVLRFVNEISRAALAGVETGQLLSLVAQKARMLVGASVAWVALRSKRDHIEVAAADGEVRDTLMGATVPVSTSLAARAMASEETVFVTNMAAEPAVLPEARTAGLGPGVYLPMLAEDGAFGTLVLARGVGADQLSHAEVAAAEVFASAAAIVIALGTTRQALEEVRMTSEHERIARDLHDTVIQRLFALGMRLQAAERLAEEPVASRIRETVDSIDQVIREIRETIFDLNRPDHDGPHLRQMVRKVTSEAAGHLGFTPRVAFRGPVEAAVGEDLSANVLAVLREALANVGRHAKASSVDVVLAAQDGDVTLSVADDGIGISPTPTAGHGLENMRVRAEELGGELKLARRNPSGTLLIWRVPPPSRSAP
jgi:two-component system, NarL family, sensor histidine kinase DevS